MISKLGDAGILGSISGDDDASPFQADLGNGHVLAFGASRERPGTWDWTRYDSGHVDIYGREVTEENMVRVVREALKGAGRA